jgi:hypothetical protein
VGYDRPALFRFLVVTVSILVALMALSAFVMEVFDWGPSMRELSRFGIQRAEPLAPHLRLGGWLLEAVALVALFLLIQGRGGYLWLDGLMAAWIGWIFRGPILVMTIASFTRLPRDPWWPLTLRWLAVYSLCGLTMAVAARRFKLQR